MNPTSSAVARCLSRTILARVNRPAGRHRSQEADRGDLNAAAQRYTRALDLARQVARPWEEAVALAGLAHGAEGARGIADATAGLRAAREIFRQMGATAASTVELGDPG
jgi:hypothetical protein